MDGSRHWKHSDGGSFLVHPNHYPTGLYSDGPFPINRHGQYTHICHHGHHHLSSLCNNNNGNTTTTTKKRCHRYRHGAKVAAAAAGFGGTPAAPDPSAAAAACPRTVPTRISRLPTNRS